MSSTNDYVEYIKSLDIGSLAREGVLLNSKLSTTQLFETDDVNRKSKRFVCSYKKDETQEIVCLLRHIRNSIAHSNVYVIEKRRKYIVFEDYNKKHNLTARILVSQTVLEKLRKKIES